MIELLLLCRLMGALAVTYIDAAQAWVQAQPASGSTSSLLGPLAALAEQPRLQPLLRAAGLGEVLALALRQSLQRLRELWVSLLALGAFVPAARLGSKPGSGLPQAAGCFALLLLLLLLQTIHFRRRHPHL